MDLERGWRTGRLDLEPLLAGHAAELAPVPSDPARHEFTGGRPLDTAAAAARYPRLSSASAMHNGEFCWIRSKTEFPEEPGSRHS